VYLFSNSAVQLQICYNKVELNLPHLLFIAVMVVTINNENSTPVM